MKLRWRAWWVVGLLTVAGAARGDEPALAHDRAAAIERGERSFRRACAACHGTRGLGDGPGADELDPRPRNLTTRAFRFRSTPSGALPRPEDLERTIRAGLPGSAMPGFGDLFSAREIADLVAFLESLQAGETFTAEPLALDPLPEAGAAEATAGRALYLFTGCWRCHGLDGSGHGPSAKTLTDDDGRPIRSSDFRHDPLKGGRTVEALVRTLRTGLNGSPMPSYDEAMLIAREDVGDTESIPGGIDHEDQAAIEALLASSPTRAELEALDAAGRAALRDRRLAALARYVLSLDRRRSAASWLLRQEPEREARE